MSIKSIVIYETKSTKFLRVMRDGYWQDATYATVGAARRGLSKYLDKHPKRKAREFTISTWAEHAKVEKTEVVYNLMNGKPVTQSVNTPASCNVSSETYWSM